MTGTVAHMGSAKDRVELANRLLSQHRYGTSEHERGYALMRDAAEAPGGAWAQWLLGAYHLQVIQRPQSQTNAAHWLQQAAAAGVPPAIERLADMSLDGIAVPFSLADAIQGMRTLAERGHAPLAWQLAYLSDRPDAPDIDAAPATLLLRTCALGFGRAYYSLGLRFAAGLGVARDPVLGRALLLRAVDAGFRDAQEAADELAPEGGAAADALRASLKANLAAAQPMLAAVGRSDAVSAPAIDPMLPKLESHLLAVGHPAFFVDAQGHACVRDAGRRADAAAVTWQWTTDLPKVGTAADFADREECAWLINKVAGSMLRPEQIARQHSANTDSELKQFKGHVRPLRMLDTDPVMRLLQRRIVETLAWRPTDMEPFDHQLRPGARIPAALRLFQRGTDRLEPRAYRRPRRPAGRHVHGLSARTGSRRRNRVSAPRAARAWSPRYGRSALQRRRRRAGSRVPACGQARVGRREVAVALHPSRTFDVRMSSPT